MQCIFALLAQYRYTSEPYTRYQPLGERRVDLGNIDRRWRVFGDEAQLGERRRAQHAVPLQTCGCSET